MTDIETMIDDAERHGRESEPDHEVGDLQTLARALWGALSPDARAKVAGAWRSWDADASDAPDLDTVQRATARIEPHHFAHPFAYEILTGPFTGGRFVASDLDARSEKLVGREVEVVFHPQDQFARRFAPERSVDDVRAILSQRAAIIARPGYAGPVSMLCSDGCQGWAVFDTSYGLEIQACDECNTLAPDADRLTDDDVAQLPEAQGALGLAQSQCPDCGGEHCPHYACVTGGAHGHCDLCSDDDE